MTIKAPGLKIRLESYEGLQTPGSAEEILACLDKSLCAFGWKGREGGPGWAMTRLFSRLVELIFDRLNQVPEKNFLAFLNAAGVELLAPRCACTELTFVPDADGPASIEVPAGTQVATVQTETQPEVVFETVRDVVVVPNALVKCVAFDQVRFSDRTREATGEAAFTHSFPVFAGDSERKRMLFLGDELFSFSDEASRKNATITLNFDLASSGEPAKDGGWSIHWLYWNGSEWKDLQSAGASVDDSTDNFQKSGNVELSGLPELVENQDFGEDKGVSVACSLKGGWARDHLPVLNTVRGARTVEIDDTLAAADAAFCAIQAGVAFIPLDVSGEFYPLGQHPKRLDTFYLRVDEAFTKEGARVEFQMDLTGLPESVENDSELKKLAISWEYYSSEGWVVLGVSKRDGVVSGTSRLDFDDTTRAFTLTGSDVHVWFNVPMQGGSDPVFAKTSVNDEEGCWVRARVIEGSFDEPGFTIGDTPQVWNPPKTHAPLIKKLEIKYGGYEVSSGDLRAVQRCWSKVDGMARDHTSLLEADADKVFSPFSASEEGPAMYLGFQQAFPPGKWIQLLVDVDHAREPWKERSKVYWEYWNGGKWISLRLSDGTRGLAQRGYLGFFAPQDHKEHTEFGQKAFWIRVRPHAQPVANAGNDKTVTLTPGEREARIVLDAGRSSSAGSGGIARYVWRSVSSNTLIADAGGDQTVVATGGGGKVTLDASGSRSLYGSSIVRYRWRLVPQDVSAGVEKASQVETPYLKAIRINTVSAVNALTLRDEIVGSSNGEPGQVFTLLRPPVLPGLELAVREPDRPPDEELRQLVQELGAKDVSEVFFHDTGDEGEQGVWVRWCQVKDFYSSGPASRHFVLDPITGKLVFGDSMFGKIPPVGRDNIKALVYRTHSGARGNVAEKTVTVLRNPKGDLQNIKSVVNPERAAGGSDAESVEEVKERGPQSLKHRHRAVTVDDFQWLALEASGEIAQARCLPGRNPSGLNQPGWVTVVITPESQDARPYPSPALLRTVKSYLEAHALANLKEGRQIYVKGPEYIEATVMARVVATIPEKADEVELSVLSCLEEFLHPLRGGPEGKGWELGRDVYLSEISAEIESVDGVDHLAGIRMEGSIQQFHLDLDSTKYAPFEVPAESRVGTFDDRIRLALAMPLAHGKALRRVAVYGFRQGDRVRIVGPDNSVLVDNLKITSLSSEEVTFDQAFDLPSLGAAVDLAVLSLDGSLRLPVAQDGLSLGPQGLVKAKLAGLKAGDMISIVAGTRRDPALEFIPVNSVEPCEDRIFVPEGYLVCSGSHDIEMILE